MRCLKPEEAVQNTKADQSILAPFLLQSQVTNCIPINIRLRDGVEVVERVRQRPRAANCEPAFGEICARQFVIESVERNPIIFTLKLHR